MNFRRPIAFLNHACSVHANVNSVGGNWEVVYADRDISEGEQLLINFYYGDDMSTLSEQEKAKRRSCLVCR